MSKVIAIANVKGGVGKTTTALNLGAALHEQGRKVLLIDFDPQGNLSKYAGYLPDGLPTIGEILYGYVNGSPVEMDTAIRVNAEGISYIPSNIQLASAEFFLITAMAREQVLKGVLSEVPKEFEYILIDCLPSLGILMINALAAADSALIPVQTEDFSIDGLDLFLNVYQSVKPLNPRLSIEGVVATMTDQTNMSKAVINALSERFGDKFCKSYISKRVEATNSTHQRKSLIATKGSKLGEQYRALASEIAEREPDEI